VFTTAALTLGRHYFTALYAGDNTFGTATAYLLVLALPSTTTSLSVSSNNVTAGTAVVFNATVKDQNSSPVTADR